MKWYPSIWTAYWLENRKRRHFRTIRFEFPRQSRGRHAGGLFARIQHATGNALTAAVQEVDRQMKIAEIKDALKATVLAGEDQMENKIAGAGSADLMDDVLAAATEGCALLTGVVTEQVIRTAKIARVAVIVFVRGKQPEKHVIALAASYNIPLLLTRYSLFVASGKLYMEGLRGLDGSW